MSKSDELKIKRTLNAVDNAFNIISTKPITLRNHINTLFEYRAINNNNLIEWFKIAVRVNRIDLALVLVTSTNYEKMEWKKTLNILFKTVCNIKAQYLKILISCSWFNFNDIDDIIIKRVLLCRLPSYIDPYCTWELMPLRDQETLRSYNNNKLARDIMLLHSKGAELLLRMEEDYPESFSYPMMKYYHDNNKKLVKMRKARWILLLFYVRHLRSAIQNMLYEPSSGIRYKKSLESFNVLFGGCR
jgi:hypothetical protein